MHEHHTAIRYKVLVHLFKISLRQCCMLSYISELKKKKKPNGAKYEMKGVLLVDEIMPNCERIIID